MSDEEKKYPPVLVPHDLARLVEAGDALESAYLPEYRAGTELWVTTASGHVYHLVLLDEQPEDDSWPLSRLCRVSGGVLSEPREMFLTGSTSGGSTVQSGRVTCGLHLELGGQPGRRMTTNIITRVSVKPFVASNEPVQ